jgi:hypothetical protein
MVNKAFILLYSSFVGYVAGAALPETGVYPICYFHEMIWQERLDYARQNMANFIHRTPRHTKMQLTILLIGGWQRK